MIVRIHTFSSFSAQRVLSLLGFVFRMSCFSSLLVTGLCYFDDKIDHRVFECLDAECEAPSDVVDFRGLIDECKFDRWPSPSTSSIAAKATRTLVVSDDIIRETAVTSTVRATVTLDPTMDHSDAGSGTFSKNTIPSGTRL